MTAYFVKFLDIFYLSLYLIDLIKDSLTELYFYSLIEAKIRR